MSDLHEALTDLHGIGDATAEDIIALVDEHKDTSAAVERAYKHARAGNARMAASYLSEVVDE